MLGLRIMTRDLLLLLFSQSSLYGILDLVNSDFCLRRLSSNSTPLTHYGSHHRLALQYLVVFTCSIASSVCLCLLFQYCQQAESTVLSSGESVLIIKVTCYFKIPLMQTLKFKATPKPCKYYDRYILSCSGNS